MARRRRHRKLDSLLAVLQAHNTGRLGMRLLIDRRVPWTLKLYLSAGLVYFFSPLDVIPHDFTGLGLLDDIIIGMLLLQTFIELSPEAVVKEHCEKLSIDYDKVLLPAPVIVKDAMELFGFDTVGHFLGTKVTGTSQQQETHTEYIHPHAPQEPPPPYSRYSAYRGEKD
jgi:uncharacterized membrane protein YkvA (DUF1232 family)